MPHCLLEYSDNVEDRIFARDILAEIHEALTGTGLFNILDIKSRIIVHHDFYIGDGDPARAFAALSVFILSGRDESTKKSIADSCMIVLKKHFAESISRLKFSVSVQINELDKATYTREGSR